MAEFKKVSKKKQFRRRRESSGDESEGEGTSVVSSIVEETKELQKLRRRANGVDAEELTQGKELPPEVVKTNNDPYGLKVGGLMDVNKLKNPAAIMDEETIGTSFAAETNRRDEDAEMLKYVENEMLRRKGKEISNSSSANKELEKKAKSAEDALFEVPEHLRAATSKKTEDMLSNQMLSGIPEVDLGIHAKIINIEATELAKQKLIDAKKRAHEKNISDFVPTNMAVNFVQHNRFNIEDLTPILKKEEAPKPKPVRVGDASGPGGRGRGKKPHDEKATDDYHYENYRKKMRY